MSHTALFWHLLNFLAPALVLALCLVLLSHIFLRPLAKPHGWLLPIALNFVVGCAMLTGGLLLLGRDGRMQTYGALVLGCASSQWLLLHS